MCHVHHLVALHHVRSVSSFSLSLSLFFFLCKSWRQTDVFVKTTKRCSATCILYKIPTVVLAENENFLGGEQLLVDNGVNVINLDSDEIKKMMKDWINSPAGKVWNEDIGEVTQS